jgi:hypothetical protein
MWRQSTVYATARAPCYTINNNTHDSFSGTQQPANKLNNNK